MTFSISARCTQSGRMGIAISSSSPAVAARCAHARAGAGVVASQNVTDPALGHKGLALLAEGRTARETLAALLDGYSFAAYRQLAIVDRAGGTAVFSGEGALGTHGTCEGDNCVAAGNLLSNETVPAAMVRAFEAARGELGDRLLAAMEAALAAGGEAGPVHSAGMVIVDRVSWPVVDLRVDWHEEDPIGALNDLWTRYKPQVDDYVKRALNPAAAPSYGVPGDL
ncbi:DUF1028 domain-containing protein [Chelativorans intermedius]|uniref:DUF1028 domain-containing protein n=1 Tax=Chelativorans intermedius TaxID=515947 RepID=A0ABV6D5M4_9HYPH|nr:DUF1028 domain-containing protein [Chelativorans intermedius]MCT8998815.1 DUF1028 domain-containing protein [Chelativorans intermedius]